MPTMPKIKRAVVLIGVQQANNLPQLQAVWKGVAAMEDWALSQSVAPDLIVKITDEDNDVFPNRISKPIKDLINRNDIEQLIVYFSGHGVIKGFSEYWMLTDGLEDANASVNVTSSVELARRSSIPHVIFISDACRTPVTTIQTQHIAGSVIFPNVPIAGEEKSVDQFYATVLGAPALEIQDSQSQQFQAIYTTALLEVLRGQHEQVFQEENEISFIRPRPLKKFLSKHLPARVFKILGAGGASQKPDARITSDSDVWLSAIDMSDTPTHVEAADDDDFLADNETIVAVEAPEGEETSIEAEASVEITSFTDDVIRKVLVDNDDLNIASMLLTGGQNDRPEMVSISGMNQQFSRKVKRDAEPFGPMHIETDCGFKIRGATVTSCLAFETQCEIHDGGKLVRCGVPLHSAASVLLVLSNGRGVLIPAIGGFLASLTFDEGSLDDVAYEPSEHSSRWDEYNSKAIELRRLRAVVASSSRMGTFQLEGENAEKLARRMQVSKGIDPSLALYAAHAYRDQGNRERIKTMASFMKRDLNFIPFDIGLLAGRLSTGFQNDNFSPYLPMLTQTWSVLPAYNIEFSARLKDISQQVMPNSLWTVFDALGVETISKAIVEGEIK